MWVGLADALVCEAEGLGAGVLELLHAERASPAPIATAETPMSVFVFVDFDTDDKLISQVERS